MRVVKSTRYICETCNDDYSTEELAKNCEARGRPIDWPTGLITTGSRGSFYGPGLAFAVAQSITHKHSTWVTLWACRDNGAGDSLGSDTCGGGTFVPDKFKPEWLTRPPFIRLVKFLKSVKIEPLVWNGKKCVPLSSMAPQQKT